MRAGLRACYNRGLASASEQSGSVRVRAELDAHGAVINATAERTGNLSQEITDCALRRVQSASFAAPNVDRVSVRFSVTFDREPREIGDGGSSRR
jgi:TonB family protein